jgi:hypothetical protein
MLMSVNRDLLSPPSDTTVICILNRESASREAVGSVVTLSRLVAGAGLIITCGKGGGRRLRYPVFVDKNMARESFDWMGYTRRWSCDLRLNLIYGKVYEAAIHPATFTLKIDFNFPPR